jgi:prolipoprotein diacylglyceryltransferase
MGFIFGWKFVYLGVNASTLFSDGGLPQAHLFSGEGSLLWGVICGVGFAAWAYMAGKKGALQEPRVEKKPESAAAYVGGIMAAAAIGGILGAKIFHLIEYPEEFFAFVKAPSLNAFLGGLTIYGGLVVGALSVWWYARRKKMAFLPLADAAAPGLMLGYGIGRIGCQVSGDGDWGIPNLAPKPGWLSWAPDWMWAYSFPNNVNGVYGERAAGYTGRLIGPEDPWPIFEGYGTYLDPGVFPTSFYETLMATALFATLWYFRKRWTVPGLLFAVYLIMNGFERFWIEKIRVNVTVTHFGVEYTQAELIAVLMMLTGAGLVLWLRKQALNQ